MSLCHPWALVRAPSLPPPLRSGPSSGPSLRPMQCRRGLSPTTGFSCAIAPCHCTFIMSPNRCFMIRASSQRLQSGNRKRGGRKNGRLPLEMIEGVCESDHSAGLAPRAFNAAALLLFSIKMESGGQGSLIWCGRDKARAATKLVRRRHSAREKQNTASGACRAREERANYCRTSSERRLFSDKVNRLKIRTTSVEYYFRSIFSSPFANSGVPGGMPSPTLSLVRGDFSGQPASRPARHKGLSTRR